MKKLLYILAVILLFTGCTELSNTPTKKAEEFLKKYQTLDNDVLTDLNTVLEEDTSLTTEQKEVYRNIMKKHYQNLVYMVNDETFNGDEATVEIEISVTDFRKVLNEAKIYLTNNPEQFNDENGNYDITKYTDYRLSKLKEAKEKVKFTIEINLTKVNDTWQVDELSQATMDKINGIFDY